MIEPGHSNGTPAAITRQLLAEPGQVAWLQIVDVNQSGAFADWGMPENLFIPLAEQQQPLSKGDRVLVKIYRDQLDRVAGSTRMDSWVRDDASGLEVGQEVSLLIADRTDLGVKAIINHRSWGLLYGNELFRDLRKGQRVTGYIKHIRADEKIDLSLEKPGFSKDRLDSIARKIIDRLEAGDGFLPLTDKSPPEAIYAGFGVSKKVFKQALGALYKQRLITLHADGTRLAPMDTRPE